MGAEACLTVRLIAAGLVRRYPAFTAWVMFDLASSLVLLGVLTSRQGVHDYNRVYALISVIAVFTQFSLGAEIFAIHLSHYRGIGSVVKFLLAVVATALFGSALLLRFELNAPDWGLVAAAVSTARYSTTAIAIFLVLVAVSFAVISVPTRRNVLVIERVGAAYFFISGMSLFAMRLSAGGNAARVGKVLQLLTATCFCLWTALLGKSGEILETARPPTPREVEVIDRWEAASNQFLRSFKWSPSKGLH